MVQGGGGRGDLLHQGGVLLGHLVHLDHRLVDLFDTDGLFAARRTDLGHDVADLLDRSGNRLHGRPGVLHQAAALLDPPHAGGDEILDLLGGVRAALGQLPHLARDDREAPPVLPGACGLDRGIEGEDVGLEGDAVDDTDDVGDLPAAGVDLPHGNNGLLSLAFALEGALLGGQGQVIGALGVVGVLAHGPGQFLHAGGGLLQ